MDAWTAAALTDAERRAPASPLLRLRSDDQLVTLFCYGDDDAFRVLHDRHRARLIAYARRMLGDSADAEDLVQDVFLEAFRALRGRARPASLRAWLYRVAHNRCAHVLDRPSPAAADVLATSQPPAHDTSAEVERREDVRSLLSDLRLLTDNQRSVLLMREIDGLTYEELGEALDLSVPAVRSLLVRARLGLAETMAARDTDCDEIRRELLEAYDRGARASRRARRHVGECESCASLRQRLFAVRRSLSALSPGTPTLAKLLGFGGFGGSGAAAGLGKVAAGVCCAAALTGAAVATHDVASSPATRAPAARSAPHVSRAGERPAAIATNHLSGRSTSARRAALERERPEQHLVATATAPAASPPKAPAVEPQRTTPSPAAASETQPRPASEAPPATVTTTAAASVVGPVATAVVAPVVDVAGSVLADASATAAGVVTPVLATVPSPLLPPK